MTVATNESTSGVYVRKAEYIVLLIECLMLAISAALAVNHFLQDVASAPEPLSWGIAFFVAWLATMPVLLFAARRRGKSTSFGRLLASGVVVLVVGTTLVWLTRFVL
jgi:hypothetical protein